MLDLDPLLLFSLDPTNGLFRIEHRRSLRIGRMSSFVHVPPNPR
jgi:hypothetical protein